MIEPSAEAWRMWARIPETQVFLLNLQNRDKELCTLAKNAAKRGDPTAEFLLRASVFEEIAQEIATKL